MEEIIKVGFVVTTHKSSLRPDGDILIENYIKTLQENISEKYTCDIYVMDNGSPDKMMLPKVPNVIHIHIQDQSLEGITGAWNRGIKIAIEQNCDIIVNTNDDITFDNTINTLIEVILNHPFKYDSIYGPVTLPGGCPGPNKQERDYPGNQILEVTETSKQSWNNGHGINGFFNAFTKECFQKYQDNGNLYSTEKKYAISGQESEMQVRLGKKGLKSFIVEGCMVYHKKIRGWQKLKI
jgi:GT2 family glycosyltransferase